MGAPVYEQVLVQAINGVWVETDCAQRSGDMAVTRCLPDDGDGWRITHLPSSHSVPLILPTADAAKAALTEMNRVVNWSELLEAVLCGDRPDVCDHLCEIAARHGGWSANGDPATRGERLERLRKRMGCGTA